MNKLMQACQTRVEIFNQELDRIIRGSIPSGSNLPPEDAQALKLAQKLTMTDFSTGSLIQQSLRNRFLVNSNPYHRRILGLSMRFRLQEIRAIAGVGMVAMLVFALAFGLLSSQHVSATPAYNTLAVTAALQQTSVLYAVNASYTQDFHPRPVPTPLSPPASTVLSFSLPERTPAKNDPTLGSRFPIITTTTSK